MGWLARLFPHHDAAPAAEAPAEAAVAATTATATEVPAERRGLNGEYDQSGLAKRIAAAFDSAGVEDAPHLYVAQTGATVVVTGHVKTQEILDHLEEIAKGIDGAQGVDSDKVTIE
ncbi:MAG: BON domain-containing protein [Vulcanimicrobiaceae bacterium]